MASEQLIFKAGLNASAFVSGMNKLESVAAKGAANVAGAFSGVAGKIGAVGAALGVGLSAASFVQATRGVFNLGDALGSLSLKTGIAVKDLLPLEAMLKDSSVNADAFGAAVNRMQKEIAAGGEAFKGLVPNFAEFKKLNPVEQFVATGKAINGIADQSQKAAKAMDIFGKSGGGLLELFASLRQFEAGSPALNAQAQMLEQNAEIFGEIADKLDRAYIPLRGFFVGFATGIAPHLLNVLDRWGKVDMAAQGEGFAKFMAKAASDIIPVLDRMQSLYGKVNGWYGKAMNLADDINRSLYGPNAGNTPSTKPAMGEGRGYKSALNSDFWRTPDTRDPKNFWRTPDPRDKANKFIGGKRGVDAQVDDLQRRFGDKLEDDDFRNRFQPRTSSEQLQSWAKRMGVKDAAYHQIKSRTRAEREAEKAAKGDSTVGLAQSSVDDLKKGFKDAAKELVVE